MFYFDLEASVKIKFLEIKGKVGRDKISGSDRHVRLATLIDVTFTATICQNSN
jgi:hypothetical protein